MSPRVLYFSVCVQGWPTKAKEGGGFLPILGRSNLFKKEWDMGGILACVKYVFI